MTPAQIEQLRAAIANMQRSQGGVTGRAAQLWNAAGGWADRFGTYISKRRQAEINKAAAVERERIRAIEANRQAQYRDTSQYRQRGTVNPGTARSSKRFQGTQKHSRFGRGGGGYILGEDILGSKGDWHRRRFPRKRNLSEVYRPQGMITCLLYTSDAADE